SVSDGILPCIGRRHRRRYTDKRNKFPNAQRHTKHRPKAAARTLPAACGVSIKKPQKQTPFKNAAR
ncbi:hypothetical protein, partial [Neisseria gonorrhoeae]|uniref:hypothetical protein n=2 Tax=Neisseria gonorrhoeae TaxID=485 RepID=UPI00064C6387